MTAKYQEGINFFKKGKFKESLEIFNELIAAEPSRTEYLLYRARVYSRAGSHGEALKDFDLLLRKEPENTDFISDRAVVLHLLQRNDEALTELNRALEKDPNNPYRYASRAFLKSRVGDLEGAIQDYEIAIEMDPEDAISLNNKGLVEEQLGYQDSARQSFDKADILVGYVPSQQPITTPESEQNEIPAFSEEEDTEERLTLSSYLSTLGNVLTDSNTREQFFKFMSGKFKGRS